MSEPSNEPSEIPIARRIVLPYHAALPTSAVTVRKCRDVLEAQLYANELAAHDIDYYVMNQNTSDVLSGYVGFTSVELQVRREDAEHAKAVLATMDIDPADVEPAEPADPDQPIPDPGREGMLATAAAFENPRSMLDAAAVLGAGHIESFLPLLVPRGDRPAGAGKRFILRVRQDDVQQAAELLSRAAAEEAEDDEPRCPRCGSYRVTPVPQLRRNLVDFLLGRHTPKLTECLRCHHRWTPPNPKGSR